MDDKQKLAATRGEIDDAREALADLYFNLFGERPADVEDADRDGRIDVFEAAQDVRLMAQRIQSKHLARDMAPPEKPVATVAPYKNLTLGAFKSHKTVRAGRIVRVMPTEDGGAVLYLIGGEINANAAWVKRHQPEGGGYFVQYEDGYTSFSPADAFDSGYTATT